MPWYKHRRKIPTRISNALSNRDLAEVRRLLTKHPEYLRLADGSDFWLRNTVVDGDLEMIKLFVELGLDVDESSTTDPNCPRTALMTAVAEGHFEIVRWLVERGATINHYSNGHADGIVFRGAVIGGHLEIVKYLVEHGADIHGHWHGVNALMDAEFYGHPEIADYLRSLGAKDLRETTPADYGDAHRRLLSRMADHHGPVSDWQIALPGEPTITLHHCPANKKHRDPPVQALFTIGLSDHRLPDEDDEFNCTELRMLLPPDWPLDEAALADPRWNWPVKWLQRIATRLRDSERLYATKEAAYFPPVFMNGDPPEPLAAETKLCGWLGLNSSSNHVQMPDCRWISLLDLHPIYTEERDVVLSKPDAWETFMQRLEERGIPMHIDPQRENAAG